MPPKTSSPLREKRSSLSIRQTPSLSRDEQRDFFWKTARLMLWFAWLYLRSHPGETVREVLRKRVNLFRMTNFYDEPSMREDNPDFETPGWRELEKAVEVLYKEHSHEDVAAEFERKAFEIFQPALENRSRHPPPATHDFSNFQAGCLRYHSVQENPGTIALHIGNPLRPRSIFDDPLYLPRCLLSVLEQSAAEFGANKLHCGSWLNSHPRWLALFPLEWQDNLSPPDNDIRWHLGFWGQFINSRGGFHEKNAAAFRSTERMPFAFRTSNCSFQSLRKHLMQQFVTQ